MLTVAFGDDLAEILRKFFAFDVITIVNNPQRHDESTES